MPDPTNLTGTPEPVSAEEIPLGIDDSGNFTGNWKETYIDEEIRNENFFNTDHAKNVKSLFKKAYNQEKELGRLKSGDKGVRIPKEGDPKEVYDAFRLAMEVPNEYQYNRPEDIDKDVFTDDFIKLTTERLNKANLNQKQFNEVMDIFQNRVKELAADGIKEMNNRTQAAIDRVEKEWGDNLESRTALARSFISKITDKWDAGKYQELFGKDMGDGIRQGGINTPEYAPLRPLLLDLFATIEENYGIPASAALSDTVETKAKSLEDELQELEMTPGFLDGKLRTSSNENDRKKHLEIMKKRSDLIRRKTELESKISR